jgi:hypothetical protein
MGCRGGWILLLEFEGHHVFKTMEAEQAQRSLNILRRTSSCLGFDGLT